MGIYDGFADTPDQIRSEGQQINVALVRDGNGGATIKWNIPSPVAGCSVEDQAYDGIVIIVSDKPANYIESSPKNGTYYTGDPTFSKDLHSGDKIDGARVVGAFYHDKTTTSLFVTDVEDKTPYYVSAYAVDNVGRYHREGAHSYSLPTGPNEYNDSQDTRAYHDIGIELDVVNAGTPTGLLSGTNYTFNILINGEKYEITIEGHDALTYPDLVDAINREFVLITDADRKDLNLEVAYYFDPTTKKLYVWDYDTYVEVDFILSDSDPSMPVVGEYWFDGETLFVYESGGQWIQVPLITLSFDPSDPNCDNVWFDGTDAWIWKDNRWCKLTTYIQTTNPLLPPNMGCSDYWYDENELILKVWADDIGGWKEAFAIYSSIDPNIIGPGVYWLNQTDDKMYVRVAGGAWNQLVNIDYEEANSEGDLDSPTAGQYWFIPSTQEFFKRNTSNTAWISLDFVLSVSDPTERKSCNLWWNSSPSVDDLYAWDVQANDWVLVSSFVQSTIDPSNPPELEENAAWYNPDTEKLQLLITPDCKFKDIEYISYPTDPTSLPPNVAWKGVDGIFRLSDGMGGWIIIDPIESENDPFVVTTGTLWYDESSDQLKEWNGFVWEVIDLLDSMVYPEIGYLVLNDADEKLYVWNGTTWVEGEAIAGVVLLNPNKMGEKNRLCFFTSARGCEQNIQVLAEAENLFSMLTASVFYYDPIPGYSRLEKGETWQTLGIGDDGSPDERRELNMTIRRFLGHPSQKVELTDDQIDDAIDSALGMIRKYSGYGYNREFFFLDLMPNQQRYVLTNRCVGFNKVVGINKIYRLRSGFLNGSLGAGGYDVFGYAALLHLYKTGTFDTLSYHLVSSYIEDMQLLFADEINYNWRESSRELTLYQAIYARERVLLDTFIERTEQDLMKNRDVKEWVKKWALAEAKLMLSQVRGKFQTLPGPQGSTTLNSQELITQAETAMAELKDELEDPAMQNLNEAGGGSHFIMG